MDSLTVSMPNLAMVQESLASRIRRLRRHLGVTQEVLAERAGMSRGRIQQLEAGGGGMRAGNLEGLADALGVSVQYLHTGKENVETTTSPLRGYLRGHLASEEQIDAVELFIDGLIAKQELERLRRE